MCGGGSMLLFFFSSRRRHTRCSRDWSSDVCSSDLPTSRTNRKDSLWGYFLLLRIRSYLTLEIRLSWISGYRPSRSEERRVGKECRSRWSPYNLNKQLQHNTHATQQQPPPPYTPTPP